MTEYDDNQWADVLGEVLEAAELRPALDQALEDNDALSSSLIKAHAVILRLKGLVPHLRRINQLQANHIKMLEEKIALLETTLKTAQQPTPERDLALLFLGTTIFFAAVSLVLIIF